MNPRLIILIVLAGGMAVYLATRPAPVVSDELPGVNAGVEPGEFDPNAAKPIWTQPLDGEEPPEVPEFDIRVEVDPSGRKNRLYFYIDEAHGYYVEKPVIKFWYVSEPGQELRDSALPIGLIVNDYVRANETYKGCIDVVPAELKKVGGDIGTDANWDVRIESWGRARSQNPDPLPVIVDALNCD